MIYRRRHVRIEIEESTLNLRPAASSVIGPPAGTVAPPSPHSLLQPSPDSASIAETEPKFSPEGTRHDI
jgi:hypothetical protein